MRHKQHVEENGQATGRLSAESRAEVVDLLKQGVSVKQIARETELAKREVERVKEEEDTPNHIKYFLGLSDEQQRELIDLWLQSHCMHESTLSTVSANGVPICWVRFPISQCENYNNDKGKSSSAADSTETNSHQQQCHDGDEGKISVPATDQLAHRWHTFSANTFVRQQMRILLLNTGGGNIVTGAFLVAKLVHSVQPEGFDLASSSPPVPGSRMPMTPTETKALEVACSLTVRQRIKIAQHLKFHLGYPILPCQHQMAKLANNYENAIVHGVPFEYEIGQEGDADFRVLLIKWWYVFPQTALVNHLRKMRDNEHQQTSWGRDFGTHTNSISIAIAGDYGDQETKVVAVIGLTNSDCQKHTYTIGTYNYKESYELFKRTFIVQIDEDLTALQQQKVVVVEYQQHQPSLVRTTFMFVSAMIAGVDELVWLCDDVGHTIGAEWANPATGDTAQFAFDQECYPPSERNEWKHCKLLQFVICCTGDLSYSFTLQGRPNHANSKCLLCNKCAADWRHEPAVGTPWTQESMKEIVQNHSPTASHTHGFTNLPCLLPSIPMNCWTIPTLHIKLGLVNLLLDNLFIYVADYLEVEHELVGHKRQQLHLLQRQLQDIEHSIAESEERAEHFNHINLLVKQYENNEKRILTINSYKQHSARSRHHTERLNMMQSNNSMRFPDAHVDGLFYGQGAVGYAAAKEALITHVQNRKELECNRKELAASLTKETKELKALQSQHKVRQPISEEMTDILQAHGICRQAFHSNTLTGEHAEKLLNKHNEILDQLTVLFKSNKRRGHLVEGVDEAIDRLILGTRELLDLLGCALYLVCSSQKLVGDTIDIHATRQFLHTLGVKWRGFFGGKHTTPKLHLLESHAADQLAAFGSLGEYSEEAIERLHHVVKKHHQTFASIKSWDQKQRASSEPSTAESMKPARQVYLLSQMRWQQAASENGRVIPKQVEKPREQRWSKSARIG